MYFTRYPLFSRLFLFVLLPIALSTFALFYWLSQSLPLEKGEVSVSGLTANTFVQYDDFGIARINAKTDIDAYTALGFVHAQNRLWQMEMNRRIAAGQLSEILGQDSLGSDIYMRTLGLKNNATKMWQQLPSDEQNILSSYVAGVNAGIKALTVLPSEYLLYDFEPAPWTEVDSLLWMQLLTVQLSSNMGAEIQRSMLVQTLGLEKTNELMPEVSIDELTQLANTHIIPAQYQQAEKYVGSNAWVVSGEKSLSGKALLANDPHLTNSLPSVFYLAEMKADQLNVSGATFPGLPFVVIGKNKDIAWGLTTMMADTQDIFLEKLNPNNLYQYEVDGVYQDMEVSTEQIIIKKQAFRQQPAPFTFTVRRTQHGPVLSDVTGTHKNLAYSLRWTGDDQNGGTFSSFLALNYAKNWTEFNDALSTFVAPIHNFVYADNAGHIGSVSPGAFPLRVKSGAVPTNGWLSENNWQGWLTKEEWPRQADPKSGVIVTANNNILANDYPHKITSDWAPSYRAERIKHLLEQYSANNRGLTLDDFKAIQMDVKHPATTKLLPYLLQLTANTEQQRKALALLKDWDGLMSTQSPQASIYTVWMAHFNRLVIEANGSKLSNPTSGDAVLLAMVFQENMPFTENVLLKEQQLTWCDNNATEPLASCNKLLLSALQQAVNELEKFFGENMDEWLWGDLHKAHYPHFPLSDNDDAPGYPQSPDSFWADFFHRSIASNGGGDTINVAPVSLMRNSRFSQFYGASYRQLLSLEPNGDVLLSLATGQSGNMLSTHYDDLMERHQQGKYIDLTELPFVADGQNLDNVLLLKPKNKGL